MLLCENGLYNFIVTALYWKNLSREGSPSLALSLSHSLRSSSYAHWFGSFSHFPSFLLSLLIRSKTSQIPKSRPTQAECLCMCVCVCAHREDVQPSGTSGPTLLHWQRLPGVFITMVTLLSGRRPLCCHGSTQANGEAILMMMLYPPPPPPPPSFSLFSSHTHIQICIHY